MTINKNTEAVTGRKQAQKMSQLSAGELKKIVLDADKLAEMNDYAIDGLIDLVTEGMTKSPQKAIILKALREEQDLRKPQEQPAKATEKASAKAPTKATEKTPEKAPATEKASAEKGKKEKSKDAPSYTDTELQGKRLQFRGKDSTVTVIGGYEDGGEKWNVLIDHKGILYLMTQTDAHFMRDKFSGDELNFKIVK